MFDPTQLGTPVEIGQIGKELKKLWESTGGATTRASLINFAVYCEGAEAAEMNTSLISEFTREHACRALLVIAEPDAPETRVRAWINAHCHLTKAGAKHVCCEQISFLFEGKVGNVLPNIVFSNLDSDLPLVFWWQGEFPDPIDEHLWAWVDRLVFDSLDWKNPAKQFDLLLASLESSQTRLALCDLNWTRSLHLRQALAQMFDHPENLAILNSLQTVAITYAPDFRSTALLLVGWFAAQLKLTLARHTGSEVVLANPRGGEVTIRLDAGEGRSIGRCEVSSPAGSISLVRDGNGDFFRVAVRLAGGCEFDHVLPAGNNQTITLLGEELALGGRHRVYIKALAVAKALL